MTAALTASLTVMLRTKSGHKLFCPCTLGLILVLCLTVRVAAVKDNDSATCMHFAAAQGHGDCLRLLLSQPGVTGEERDAGGATVAFYTCFLECISLFSFFYYYYYYFFIRIKAILIQFSLHTTPQSMDSLHAFAFC